MVKKMKDNKQPEPFPILYRPNSLDEIVGNEPTIKTIEALLQKPIEKIPHAWLFTGGSGMGKTTLARIVKDELGCDAMDFKEYNASNTRGIETIRKLQEKASLYPRNGSIKVYLLDECFWKNTSIETPNGDILIKNITKGMEVTNIYGTDIVEQVAINKIPLSRLCKVNFIGGKSTYTTKDHLYFTDKGWVESQHIGSLDCMCHVSNQVRTIELNKEGLNENFRKEKTRSEESKKVESIRVESVEIYERGSNDESFDGVISDKERNQGFIEMYDLKVKNHPSYKADGVIVHNCHMVTREGQNALLKLLEDPPSFVYFFLCTTNPEKLIRPIHSRCTTIKVSPVSSKKMVPFINEILFEEIGEQEVLNFDKDVIKAIADNSNGACRDALKLLDMIIDMQDYDDMLDVIEQGVPQEGDLKTLCDLLKTPRSTWKDYSAFLRSFTGEPESLRQGVLNWFTTMLLSDGNQGTAEIMEAFESNYYDSGKAGLVLSCFQVSLMK